MMTTLVWIGGIALGAVVSFVLGYLLRARQAGHKLGSAEREAQRLLEDAGREAESVRRSALLESKEESLRLRQQAEREVQASRTSQIAAERAFQEREAAFNRRVELIDKKERDAKRQEQELARREQTVDERSNQLAALLLEQRTRLEKVAGMTAQEAKAQLVAAIESEARAEAARLVADVRENAQRNAEREARRIVTIAIQRYAGDQVSESTVSVVHLPSDDMKGRIIGREGRNIRSFETITGVDVIIDDTPEAVILSAFDPVRREIARQALERLVADGRIHPARIEEIVAKVKVEVESRIHELGELACLEVGVHGIHPELQQLLGRLHYRTSYGQNILRHSIEVAHLAGMMAAELGLDQKTAKRGGLLHDIGKAIDHEQEGTHPALGMEVAARYGEPQPVLEAIGYHHDDYAGGSLWPVLVAAADAVSGARPGARRESLEIYIKRLEALEKIASQFPGVEKSYAIQAGREIRILVEHAQVDDARAQGLAGEIARRIEKELEYPGQIRVTVIRETRAVEYAR
ncbi:MAG: ribonuclease Y [Candidatus Eisenbacteria bacterium]|uniref:Ribonuclease Y n=1 Tax=Eiseniibacteriota bacterium TaxID=2212470 RepID=A0A538TXQ1_UNCEI|nr:MAG: ribonuclease Y [Candidatus Eisenbacteria bacterium]